MKKRKSVFLTIVVLILGFTFNILLAIIPETFKDSIRGFTINLGLSYTLFWIICTSLIVVIMLFFVWKQALNETKDADKEKQPIKIKKQINQNGDKSIYIEKNKGDINVK